MQDKEITSILEEAVAAVEAANVPEDLRAIAFEKAIALALGSTTLSEGEEAGTQESAAKTPDVDKMVGERLRVPPSLIADAFELDDDSAHIIVAPSQLPRQRAAAMRDVALLISSVRQTVGLDEDNWTSVDEIREECRRLGVLDGPNFATEIGRMGAFLSFKGGGRSRQVRVNMRGYEEAGRRLSELLGPGA